MRSLRSPTSRTTVSVYSDQPAESSSLGRSTATGSCPRSRSSGATRCQSHRAPTASVDERERRHYVKLANWLSGKARGATVRSSRWLLSRVRATIVSS
jgi:hypothetical protein